uniref:Putative secreted protein n=1 Tax=Anopheles triannulatus TaxID=58253 RepID=A0A2M4B0Z0_9DIPT
MAFIFFTIIRQLNSSLATVDSTIERWSCVWFSTIFRSSRRVQTPFTISVRSEPELGHGYSDTWYPVHTFLMRAFSCSPWKKATNTVLYSSFPVDGSSRASSSSTCRRKMLPREIRHSIRSNPGIFSRWITPATKPSRPRLCAMLGSSAIRLFLLASPPTTASCSKKNDCVRSSTCFSSVNSR